MIQVPFKAGNQFLGEDGLQDVYYNIRDKTRIIADHHANLGKTIEGSIVQHLQKLHFEIKAHIKNVQNDTGKLANSVARERELSTKHISDLARAISTYKNTPMTVTPKEDPYCQNQIVLKQLQRQVRPRRNEVDSTNDGHGHRLTRRMHSRNPLLLCSKILRTSRRALFAHSNLLGRRLMNGSPACQ